LGTRELEGSLADEDLPPFQPSPEAACAFWGISLSELDKGKNQKPKRAPLVKEEEEVIPELHENNPDEQDEVDEKARQEQLAKIQAKKAEREELERKYREEQQAADAMSIHQLAREMSLPTHDLRDACQFFREFADASDDDDLFAMVLSMSRFKEVLCKMCGVEDVDELSKDFVALASSAADRDGGGSIDVREFAAWYSSMSFSEELTLDSDGKEMRRLARYLNAQVFEIEEIKKQFDLFDTDRSGQIDLDEFEQLITALLRVPGGQEISANRVRSLWSTATGGATLLHFPAFCLFYMNVLQPKGGEQTDPFTDFYRNVRRVDVAYEYLDRLDF